MINVDTYFNVGIYDDTMHISSTNMKTAHYIDMRSPLTFGLSLCIVHSLHKPVLYKVLKSHVFVEVKMLCYNITLVQVTVTQ